MIQPPRISKSRLHSLRKLTQKKYRKEDQEFLIEGRLMLREAFASGWSVETLLVSESFLTEDDAETLLAFTEERGIESFLLTDIELNNLTDVVTPQGVIAVASWKVSYFDEVVSAGKENQILVAVDQINDPGNLGTIIRTSDWFKADGVIISENSVELYSPKVVRATMGSIFHLPVFHDESLYQLLGRAKQKGYKVIACSVGANESVHSSSFDGNCFLLFGSESHGIRPEILQLADSIVSIPRYGNAESLNVGIACGIVLATARNKKANK